MEICIGKLLEQFVRLQVNLEYWENTRKGGKYYDYTGQLALKDNIFHRFLRMRVQQLLDIFRKKNDLKHILHHVYDSNS